MNQKKLELYFLLTLVLGVFVVAFFIFKPFLYVLLLAVVFATVFGSVHKKIFNLVRKNSTLAALLTTIIVLIVVIVPLVFLGTQLLREATQLYSTLMANGGATNISQVANDITQRLTKFSPVPIKVPTDINQYLKQGLNWLLQNLAPFFANLASAIMDVFIFLMALYYLFKDGHKLKSAVIILSPLQDVHDETIFNKLALAINSVVKGSLTVALIQGTLTAIGFMIFGIPSATLWGSMAAITALVPGVGTAPVMLPTIIYLFISGATFPATGLLIWWLIAVGLIDNFLGPKLVQRGIQLHPFLVLLSIFGGIGFFGPLGFLLGPLVLSLLFALLDIYFVINKEYEG